MIKVNCFGYDREKQECRALKELYCKYTDNCKFYCNKKQVDLNKIEKDIEKYSKNSIINIEEGD